MRYTLFFIVVSAVHVSSCFSAHHQELNNCTCNTEYVSKLFAATANVDDSEHSSDSSTVIELLMMSGKVARNMCSTDNNK